MRRTADTDAHTYSHGHADPADAHADAAHADAADAHAVRCAKYAFSGGRDGERAAQHCPGYH